MVDVIPGDPGAHGATRSSSDGAAPEKAAMSPSVTSPQGCMPKLCPPGGSSARPRIRTCRSRSYLKYRGT